MSYQRKLLGQQLGAYVFRDPPLVIANHELARTLNPFWITDYSSAVNNSISNIEISFGGNQTNQTIFWGDGDTDSFQSGASLTHSWASSLGQAQFTPGTLTNTTSGRLSGNYVRGSSKNYEKLI